MENADCTNYSPDHIDSSQYAEVALLLAAIEAYDVERRVELSQFYASAARGRPRVRQGVGLPIDFQHLGQHYRFRVVRPGAFEYYVTVDGQSLKARIEQLGPLERSLLCYGRCYRVASLIEGPNYSIDVEGSQHQMIYLGGGMVRSPAPAVVASVAISPGDYVERGDLLIVVETMKMEMAITA